MPRRSNPSDVAHASALLSASDLLRRWQAGSDATLWRAEKDGLLLPVREGRRRGYSWETIWAFEGGQPPAGMEAAYRKRLLTPEQAAMRVPYRPSTLITKARERTLPCRRIGTKVRFVAAEIDRWLCSWL